MEYELVYVQRRALEERQAAQSASSAGDRDQHLKLARAFEEHLSRLSADTEIRARQCA